MARICPATESADLKISSAGIYAGLDNDLEVILLDLF
jgi:hypothetical protein